MHDRRIVVRRDFLTRYLEGAAELATGGTLPHIQGSASFTNSYPCRIAIAQDVTLCDPRGCAYPHRTLRLLDPTVRRATHRCEWV
jgi:hypothetical protein